MPENSPPTRNRASHFRRTKPIFHTHDSAAWQSKPHPVVSTLEYVSLEVMTQTCAKIRRGILGISEESSNLAIKFLVRRIPEAASRMSPQLN